MLKEDLKDYFFLYLYIANNTPPTRTYGNTIRYMIPLLIPFAIPPSPSLSRTARHMAHCASARLGIANNSTHKKKMRVVFMSLNLVIW